MLTQQALGQLHASLYCTTKYRQDYRNCTQGSRNSCSSHSSSDLCPSTLACQHLEQDEQVCVSDATGVTENRPMEEAERPEANTQAEEEIMTNCRVDVKMRDAATQTDLHLTELKCEWERRYNQKHKREYKCAPISSIGLEHKHTDQTNHGRGQGSVTTAVTLITATLSPNTSLKLDKAVQTPLMMLLPLIQLRHTCCLSSSSSVSQQEASGATSMVGRLPQLHTIFHPTANRERGPKEGTSSSENSTRNSRALLHLTTNTTSQAPLHKTDWQAFKLLAHQRYACVCS